MNTTTHAAPAATTPDHRINAFHLRGLRESSVNGTAPLLWIETDPTRADDLWDEADWRLSAATDALGELACMSSDSGAKDAVANIASALNVLLEDARELHIAARKAFVEMHRLALCEAAKATPAAADQANGA